MKRYGVWAGNPKGCPEDATCCVVEVAEGGRPSLFYQCSRKRGHGIDGLRCKQHASSRFDFWVPKDKADRRAAGEV